MESKKRGFNQITNEDGSDTNQYSNFNPKMGIKKLKRGPPNKFDVEERIERGGSSQDKFESDFIDDGSDPEQYGSKDSNDEYKIEQNHSSQKIKKLKKQVKSLNVYENGLSDDFLDQDEINDYCDDDVDERKIPNKMIEKTTIKKIEEDSDEDMIYDKLTKFAEDSKSLQTEYKFNPDDNKYYLPGDFSLPKSTYDNLFDHQKQGIQWLYNLWDKQQGGVLGDDMGLGKTVQVACYLKGLFDAEYIKKVLVVVPATMKVYWQNELKKWISGIQEKQINQDEDEEEEKSSDGEHLNIIQLDDKKKQNRYDQIKKLRKKGGILVTSYGMITTERLNLSEIRYDVIILDEGHKAKNRNTQFRRDITNLKVKGHRLILTGTPLQNNFSELWSVFDFVQPKIFGSFEKFQNTYGSHIEKGMLKDSTERQKQYSQQLSQKLRQIYQKHFLRRTKKNVFTEVSAETLNRPLKLSELPLKTDLVVWVPLAKVQKQLYIHILETFAPNLQQIMKDQGFTNIFSILSYLKIMCQHPYFLCGVNLPKKRELGLTSPDEDQILMEQDRQQKENYQENHVIRTRRGKIEDQQKPKKVKEEIKNEELEKKDYTNFNKGIYKILDSINNYYNQKNIDDLINQSVKTNLLFTLMKKLKQEGNRVLIFSMSKKMLDLLEFIISGKDQFKKDFKYFRIDGDTEIQTRDQICKDFNQDKSIFCGLLTTKVGGFGLNLIGANRAIILDPDWNPANDNQAVDRCYRIGQKSDVIVYRFVSIGGIEEIIYRRQIHKKGMSLQTVEGSNEIEGGNEINDKEEISDEKALQKYFSDSDLFKLFVYNQDDNNCQTLKMIIKNDQFNYEETPTNLQHIKYLQDQKHIIKGITLHSNLYSLNELNGESNDDVDLLQRTTKQSSDNDFISNN